MKKEAFRILSFAIILISISACQDQQLAKDYEALKNEVEAEKNKLELNKSVVRRAHAEVWSSGNMEVVDELYSEDFVGHWVSGGDTGLEELKQMISESRGIFPDLNEKIIHIVAENDLVVTYFISSGTFTGEMNGIQPNGKKGSRPEVAVHRLENGKIVEQWTVADLMTLLTQLEITL